MSTMSRGIRTGFLIAGVSLLVLGMMVIILGWDRMDKIASVGSWAVTLIGALISVLSALAPDRGSSAGPDHDHPPTGSAAVSARGGDHSRVYAQGHGTINITKK